MSEFSESYHLKTDLIDDVAALLKAAGLTGYVFPSMGGWTTFVANGSAFTADPRITAAAPQILLHFVSAEDHGWSFGFYEQGRLVCGYSCFWEEDIHIDDSLYARSYLQRLMPAAALAQLDVAFYPRTFDDVFEQNAASLFAQAIGLKHFEWTAYDSIARDRDEPGMEYPDLIHVE